LRRVYVPHGTTRRTCVGTIDARDADAGNGAFELVDARRKGVLGAEQH
jgi:hypothetical protein